MKHNFNGRLAVVTCTRDRSYALSLCQKYIERQTMKPDLWIVASEGNKPKISTSLPLIHDHDSIPRLAGKYSHCRNIMRAIKIAQQNDINGILIMEDDDWYRGDYIEFASELLNNGQVSTYKPVRYFHLINGSTRVSPVYPFSQMGFQESMFDEVFKIANNATELIDGALWTNNPSVRFLGEDEQLRVLSIKSMYGSHGVTNYHDINSTVGNKEFKGNVNIYESLVSYIGEEDAKAYGAIIKNGPLLPDYLGTGR